MLGVLTPRTPQVSLRVVSTASLCHCQTIGRRPREGPALSCFKDRGNTGTDLRTTRHTGLWLFPTLRAGF